MIITDTDLIMKGACVGQVNLFRKVFGTEVEVTKDSLFQAYVAMLWVHWFVEEFLGKNAFWRYDGKRASWFEGWKLGLMSTTKYYENLSELVMQLVGEYEANSKIPKVS